MKNYSLQAENYVRELTEEDIPSVLELYHTNMEYFALTGESPDKDTVKSDMSELPEGKSKKDKRFLGFFRVGRLEGVLDILEGYPDADTVYIGLLMTDGRKHRQGTGTAIMRYADAYFFQNKYKKVRLAVIKENRIAFDFWKSLGFDFTGEEKRWRNTAVCIMEKEI